MYNWWKGEIFQLHPVGTGRLLDVRPTSVSGPVVRVPSSSLKDVQWTSNLDEYLQTSAGRRVDVPIATLEIFQFSILQNIFIMKIRLWVWLAIQCKNISASKKAFNVNLMKIEHILMNILMIWIFFTLHTEFSLTSRSPLYNLIKLDSGAYRRRPRVESEKQFRSERRPNTSKTSVFCAAGEWDQFW